MDLVRVEMQPLLL